MKKFLSVLTTLIIICTATSCALVKNPMPQQTATTLESAPDTSSFIGEDKAKELALQAAGITNEGVVFEKAELDRDNGITKYEVEFRQGTTDWDVDIKADDGTVLEIDKDTN